MPGDPHPLAVVYGAGNVDKAAVIADGKVGYRRVFADADEVRAADLSGQWLIHVRSLSADFKLDTEDTQEDDGVNVITHGGGQNYIKEAVTLTEVDKNVEATGNVTLDDDESADNIFIENTSSSPITVYLPDAAARTKTIRIIDAGNNAGTYPITVSGKNGSGQTVLGQSSWVIDSNSSSILLKAKSDGSGYL